MMVNTPTGVLDLDTAPLPDVAGRLREQWRDTFDPASERDRQMLNLAEEAGEFVGAYRRWAGMARRSGPWSDVEAELADVLIAAHVTAAAFGHTLPEPEWAGRRDTGSLWIVKQVFIVTADALAAFQTHRGDLREALTQVSTAAARVAAALDIDLDAVWRAKARAIFTRGWRETNPAEAET